MAGRGDVDTHALGDVGQHAHGHELGGADREAADGQRDDRDDHPPGRGERAVGRRGSGTHSSCQGAAPRGAFPVWRGPPAAGRGSSAGAGGAAQAQQVRGRGGPARELAVAATPGRPARPRRRPWPRAAGCSAAAARDGGCAARPAAAARRTGRGRRPRPVRSRAGAPRRDSARAPSRPTPRGSSRRTWSRSLVERREQPVGAGAEQVVADEPPQPGELGAHGHGRGVARHGTRRPAGRRCGPRPPTAASASSSRSSECRSESSTGPEGSDSRARSRPRTSSRGATARAGAAAAAGRAGPAARGAASAARASTAATVARTSVSTCGLATWSPPVTSIAPSSAPVTGSCTGAAEQLQGWTGRRKCSLP